MRVTREQAEKNRATVVDTASQIFRERGFDGAGIADVMKAAGLTHGGFYGQFRSKDHLTAEASSAALGKAMKKWQAALSAAPEAPLEAVVDFYLTPQHRDHPGRGCAFAALAADAARGGDEIRARFQSGFEDYLAMIEPALAQAGEPADTTRQTAMAALSTLVGALVLSRAMNDPDLSNELLKAAGASLTGTPGG